MMIYKNHRFDLDTAELIAGDVDHTWIGKTKKGTWFLYADDEIQGALMPNVDCDEADFVEFLIESGFAEVVDEHFPRYADSIPEA